MKTTVVSVLLLTSAACLAQDPWKNVYSHHAWIERDRWQRASELIDLLKISSGSHVADIGCHEGYMTFKLARVAGKSGLVYAVDVDEGKLDKVRSRAEENKLTQIRVVRGDADNPRLPANSLDAAIILDTYHEMDDHGEILKHIHNSLKEGGRLLICDPIADSRRGLSRAEQERKHELALEFARVDLEKAGYTIVFQRDNFIDRTREKGDWMWVIVAEKKRF